MTMRPKRDYPNYPGNEGVKRRVPRIDPFESETSQSLVLEGWKEIDIETVSEIVRSYLGDETFTDQFVRSIELIKKKNADYSRRDPSGDRDRVAAFRRAARDLDIPMRKVWAAFAGKHWDAVMKFVRDGSVESESIDSRIDDMINYFVLLRAILDAERSEGAAETDDSP